MAIRMSCLWISSRGGKHRQPAQKRQPQEVHPRETAPLIHSVRFTFNNLTSNPGRGVARAEIFETAEFRSILSFIHHFSPTISRSVWAA